MKWWKYLGTEKKEGVEEEMNEYNDKNRIDYEQSNKKKETKEIWKDVVGYERWYEVSNLGNVRKINRDGTTKILKAKPNAKGRTVGLRKVGSVKTYQVSHLVAEAFKVPTTDKNKNNVYHIDGDANNDCLSNLTYDKKETDKYKEEHKDDMLELVAKNEERKEELFNYIENNRVFLQQAKANKEVSLKEINDTLNKILDLLKTHLK